MLDLLEKTVISAIGVAAVTQKKAEELVGEIRDKYKLNEDEGRILVEKIQGIAGECREKVREMASEEVKKVVDKLGLVTRDEFEQLAKRVQDLETRSNQ